MVQALKAAFSEAGKTMADVDYRITDSNGEQYFFKEAALAVARTLRVTKEKFEIWHPADCVGEVGRPPVRVLSPSGWPQRARTTHPVPILCATSAREDGDRIALMLTGGNGAVA